MDVTGAKAASDLLIRHWRDGTVLEDLPAQLRPLDRADGYLIQAQLEGLSALRGWKIASTSAAGQAHIGVDGPLAGRLLAEMIYPDGATVPFGANRMRVAEAEFAFRIGRDLPPRATPYTMDEVLNAVVALHPAIEVPDSRYADFAKAGAAQLLTDNACGHQFVLGPEAPAEWRGMDLAAHRVIGRVGDRLERDGRGSNVLGDPRFALTWLVNELSRYGMIVATGQIVTTGTCLVPMEIGAGEKVSVEYDILGQVGLSFSEA